MRTSDLVLERHRLEEEIRAKKHDPHARVAEINRELEREWTEQERKEAARQERIQELLAAYVPARDRTDALTTELADAMERAADLRLKLKELRAAPESVHVRAARRDPTNLKPNPLGAARFRLRRALHLDY